MTGNRNNPHCAECRLVLIESQSLRILTTTGTDGPQLPRESIPASTRYAESLTVATEERYGLRSIQLALLPEAAKSGYCAVHEIIDLLQALPGRHSFVSLDEIASNELADDERTTVLRIMKGEASELGRFARIGWIGELLAKTGTYQDRSAWPMIQQLNQGINFCLLSLTDSSRHKVWFKAVGEPNVREYALTADLERRFPSYLPKILATIPEWNGWVMEDVVGVPLYKSDSIYQCEQALTALAVMQQKTANDVAFLSALGAKDWTCARIASLFVPFFREALVAMQAQASAKSKPLSASELWQLQKDMESAFDELMSAGIPQTLMHGDIGHGNTIATCEGPVFLDWAETYIGHPFLSAEHLLDDLARSNALFAKKQADLRSHYAAYWKSFAGPETLGKITVLAPAVAAFVCAIMAWENSHNRLNPSQAWPLMRFMLRRAKRELEQAPEAVV